MLAKAEAPKKPRKRKAYQPPEMRSITFEQASLILVARAWVGHRDAQQLLRLLFPRD